MEDANFPEDMPKYECGQVNRQGEKCGHIWIPRTPNPVQCPKCRSRNWRKIVEKKSDK